jgi:hypothetical protein
MKNMKAAIIELDKLIAKKRIKTSLTELQELKSKLLQALDGFIRDKQDK